MTRKRIIIVLFMMIGANLLVSCAATYCDTIMVKTQVFGPTVGSTTLCVQPSECREDTMTTLVATDKCGLTDNDCGKGDEACGANQLCEVKGASDPGLIVTDVTWDRNSPCEKPKGTSKCTAKWKVPVGSSLHCVCSCSHSTLY